MSKKTRYYNVLPPQPQQLMLTLLFLVQLHRLVVDKIFLPALQKSQMTKSLIMVVSLKTGKEPFNFLEPELSKEYYLAMEKLLENGMKIPIYNVHLSRANEHNV